MPDRVWTVTKQCLAELMRDLGYSWRAMASELEVSQGCVRLHLREEPMSRLNWERAKRRRDSRGVRGYDFSDAAVLRLWQREQAEKRQHYPSKSERRKMHDLAQRWLRTHEPSRGQTRKLTTDDINLLLAEARRKPAQ